jgi:hypothetical protein
VETDPTVMCQLLVGLPTVTVLGVVDEGVDTPLTRETPDSDGVQGFAQRAQQSGIATVMMSRAVRPARCYASSRSASGCSTSKADRWKPSPTCRPTGPLRSQVSSA